MILGGNVTKSIAGQVFVFKKTITSSQTNLSYLTLRLAEATVKVETAVEVSAAVKVKATKGFQKPCKIRLPV